MFDGHQLRFLYETKKLFSEFKIKYYEDLGVVVTSSGGGTNSTTGGGGGSSSPLAAAQAAGYSLGAA